MAKTESESVAPYFDDEEARLIIGKRLLVGVTFRNKDESIARLEQFHGTIIRASREEGVILRIEGTGEERWTPPDLSRLERASPGKYQLIATGEVVEDPDLLSTWTVYPPIRH